MAKKQMRGGMDPRELAKLATEARRQKRERAEEAEQSPPAEVDVADLPRAKLIAVLRDPRTHPRDLVAAAKALDSLPADDEDTGWKASVQVRPDFVPPDWPQVLLVAKAAGAFD